MTDEFHNDIPAAPKEREAERESEIAAGVYAGLTADTGIDEKAAPGRARWRGNAPKRRRRPPRRIRLCSWSCRTCGSISSSARPRGKRPP